MPSLPTRQLFAVFVLLFALLAAPSAPGARSLPREMQHATHHRRRHRRRHPARSEAATATTPASREDLGAGLPTLLGSETIEPQHDYLIAGQAEAFRFQAGESGVSGAAHVYVDWRSRARTLVVGLYANAGSHPGALLSSGWISAPRNGTWDAVPLTPATLTSAGTYWLAILGEGGTLRFRDRGDGPCPSESSSQTNLAGLPAEWSTGPQYRDCPVSGYVSASSLGVDPPEETTPPQETTPPTEKHETTPPTEKPPTEKTETPKTEEKSKTEETPKKEEAPQKEETPKTEEKTKTEETPPAKEAPGEEKTPPTKETTPPGQAPPPSPACTQTDSSVSAATSALASGNAGSAICLSAGSYGHLSLSGKHSANVTIEPVPGAVVSVEGVSVASNSSYITVHDFDIGGGVSMAYGDSHITVDHNNIDGEESGGTGEGVEDLTVNCTAPNAPTYSGCTSTAPDTYITINGNKIHGYGQGDTEDAIHLNNWEHVTITANDIYALEEHGNHTDAMQSVFGGHHMLFERNYEHDNQSQGFFIKDGDASDVTVNDNLFLRNNNEPSLYPGGEYNIQVFDTTELTITNNTVWDGQDDILRAEGAAEALTATVNHNVEQTLDVLHEGGPAYSLSENDDIFREAPWTFTMGSQSKVESSPDFVDAATEDYELASNPNDVGVNWQPSEYVYGPTGD
jgi:hypothetical protein